MKNLVLLTLFCIGFISYSQDWEYEKPNYDQIEKNIKKKESNLFYPKLMNRYLASDSTLNIEERRHLYFGYIYEKEYSPYATSDYDDSLRTVLQKETLAQKDYEKIVDFTNKMMKDKPFDIKAINHQLYALHEMGNQLEFDKKIIQLRILVDALLSSGNGKTKEEAFYVIYTSNEYDLLNILGFPFGGSQSLIEHYDYLTVAPNEYEIKGLYFDVSPCLNSMSKMFED